MKNKCLILFSALSLFIAFNVQAKVCVKNSTRFGQMFCAYGKNVNKPTSKMIPTGQSCKYNHSEGKTLAAFILNNHQRVKVKSITNIKDGSLYVCTGGSNLDNELKVTCKKADRKCK